MAKEADLSYLRGDFTVSRSAPCCLVWLVAIQNTLLEQSRHLPMALPTAAGLCAAMEGAAGAPVGHRGLGSAFLFAGLYVKV